MDSQLAQFISQTLGAITLIAGISSAFLLVRSGYLYISSSGHPDQLYLAKQSIKHTLIGLVLVLAASTLVAIATNTWHASPAPAPAQQITVTGDRVIPPIIRARLVRQKHIIRPV